MQISAILIPIVAISVGMNASVKTYDEDVIGIARYCDGTTEDIYAPSVSSSKNITTNALIPDEAASQDDYVSPTLIFGDDERTILTDTSKYTLFPYRAVCRVAAGYDTDGDGYVNFYSIGTGAIVGPHTVLSCSHIFYKTDYGWPIYYEAAPGAYTNQTTGSLTFPNGKYSDLKKITIGTYFRTGDANDDWSFIDFNTDFGSELGYFGVSSSLSQGDTVKLYGYHGDLNGLLGYGTGQVTYCSTYKFYHNCDAISGSSGGPLFKNGTTLVGMHSGGVDSTQDAACKVSSYIASWVQERLDGLL